MAYRINKTDGSILTDLIDGVVDTSTTDLALIGRNYSGFGEVLNENFVKLLENFSSTSAPENALRGQLWYDVAENRLKVYNGETFVSASGNIVGNVASNVDTGDIFVDTSVDQLKFYNGSTFVTVGPTYTSSQGKTGVEGIDIVDTVGVSHTVLGQYIAGVLRGIWSTVNTTPNAATTPAGWTAGNALQIGFNPVDAVNYKYRAAASSTDSLNDALGNSYIADDFVKVEERDSLNNLVDQRIESGLFVKSTSGLTVGYQDAKYATLRVEPVGPISVLDVERQNNDFAIRITEGTAKVNAIKIDSSERYIGIFNNTPTATLDVTGTVKATEFIGDFKGTIVADDSTILVDAVNGLIPSANLSGALPAIDGSALTGINAVATFVDLNDTSVGGQATDTLIRFDGANYVPTSLTEDASGNITVTGNLTVQGTTTQVDSNTVNIGDSIITLNSDETGAPTQNAGIEVERGTSTNVQLRWNESNDKWEVTEDGVAYSDILTAAIEGIKTSGNLRFNDNVKATFGTSNDLEIYHDGSDSYISEQGTGSLKLLTSFFTVKNGSDTKQFLNATNNGAVKLFYDNDLKIETTSTGVEVTGNLVVSGQIETSTIDTADSSALSVTPSTIFSSDVTVENVLYLNNPPDFGVPINLPSGSTLGGVPIGTTEGGGDADTLNLQAGSYYLDGANFTGTLPNDYVTLGTMTTGNYVATIAGTANEIEITGSGSETAAVTVGLPNDVTIGNELTVTTGLFTPLIDTTDSSAISITPDVVMSAGLTVGNHIVPSSNENIDLGSASFRFRDLYLSGQSIDLGGVQITKSGSAIELPAGSTIQGVQIGTVEGGGDADTLNLQAGSYYLDGANFTGTLPNDYVTLGTMTTGNYVQQGATSGNGISGSVNSEGGTFTVSSNATDANTASTIVYRDASGNFSAGTITAALSGNASTASAMSSAVTVELTGDVTGSATFTNAGDTASIAATLAANSIELGTDTTGDYVYRGATSGNGISGSAAGEGLTFTVTSNATENNTASTIVFRDASGNFSAGTITATAIDATSLFTPTIDTVDSSAITVTPATIFKSDVTVENSIQVDNDLIVSGNLTVQGTTTQVDSNVVNIGDAIITLNSDETGIPSQNAGIEVERGTSANVQVRWNETTDKWQVTEDGTAYSNILTTADEGTGNGLDADTVDGIEAAAITQSGDSVELTGDVTGSTTVGADGAISITTTIAANSVALGTDTTGNYVATVAGTANEVEVSGSGSETAAVTIGLPNDVTIGNDLTVTNNLTVTNGYAEADEFLFNSALTPLTRGFIYPGGGSDVFYRTGGASSVNTVTFGDGGINDHALTLNGHLETNTKILTPLIDTSDSSALTIEPATVFNSDVAVENDLIVTNKVTATDVAATDVIATDVTASSTIQDAQGNVRALEITTDSATSVTIASGSSGKYFRLTGAATTTVNINAGNFAAGDIFTLHNATASDMTIDFDANFTDTVYIAGDGIDKNNSTVTLAAYGIVTCIAFTANGMIVNGNVS